MLHSTLRIYCARDYFILFYLYCNKIEAKNAQILRKVKSFVYWDAPLHAHAHAHYYHTVTSLTRANSYVICVPSPAGYVAHPYSCGALFWNQELKTCVTEVSTGCVVPPTDPTSAPTGTTTVNNIGKHYDISVYYISIYYIIETLLTK